MVAGVKAHIEVNMAMGSHREGSEEGYKMKERGAKIIHKNQMSQEELDKELDEISKELDELKMLLEENQRQGWVLRKKTVK